MVRSVYIKIINYSGGSILANLNNTMQSKQHATKKTYSYLNIHKIYQGLCFVVQGFLAENVQNIQFLFIQSDGSVFNISLFLDVLFSYALRIFELGIK